MLCSIYVHMTSAAGIDHSGPAGGSAPRWCGGFKSLAGFGLDFGHLLCKVHQSSQYCSRDAVLLCGESVTKPLFLKADQTLLSAFSTPSAPLCSAGHLTAETTIIVTVDGSLILK